MKKITACLAACLLAGSANAIVIDPDSYAAGTDISNAFSGVTLSTAFGQDPYNPTSYGSVYSVADSNATTGSNAFGQSSSNSTWGNGSFEYLLVEFDTATNFVSLDFFSNDSSDHNPELIAFDGLGNEIDRSSFFGAVNSSLTLSVSSAATQIASVWAFWDETSRGDNGGLDRLEYNAAEVSEPATLALLGLGLAGIGFTRKKKQS